MALNNFLRGFIVTGLFALLFVPLYVPSDMFFPFISGKNFAFRIIVELMAAALAILAYRDASYRPKKSWMLIAAAVFLVIIALADIFGENFYRSFWSNYERMEGLMGHIHFFLYFLILSTVLTAEKLWTRFFQTSLFVSAILSVYGLLQLSGSFEIHQGGVRLDATLGNATYLAVYMLFHVFIAAWMALREDTTKGMRWVYAALGLLNLFILYHTATRGAILGLLGGTLLTAILLIIFNRESVRLRRFAIGAIAGVMLLVGGVFLFKDSALVKGSPVLSRFASISLDEATTKSRFLIWNMSLQGVKEHPLLGWGQENYILVFNKYYDAKMYAQEPWFDRSHNVFFDWLISGGILALLAYLSLFSIALYYLFKPGSPFSPTEKALFAGFLGGYFFQNIFVFDNLTSYMLFYAILAYILFRHESAKVAPIPSSSRRNVIAPSRTGHLFAPAVLAVTLLVLYFGNIRPILASMTLIDALKPQESLDKNLEYFEKAISYGTFGSGETREQLVQGAVRILGASAPMELKQKFFDTAQREMQKQIEENPKDARYELFFGSFFNSFGLYDDALVHLKRARELSPEKQLVLFEEGRSYLSKGQYQEALGVFKDAYELEPRFDQARFLYGVAALYARQDSLASQILTPMYGGTLLIPDERVIGAYAARGEYGKVVSLWQSRIAGDPTNSQHRLSLAAAYLQMGERGKAVTEIRKVIVDNPSFKEQGEYYIREIEAGRNP